MKASPIRIVGHAALLLAPLVVAGRFEPLSHPRAIVCVLVMLLFAELEAAACTRSDSSRADAPGTRLALVSALGLLATAWAAVGFPSLEKVGWWAWLGAPLIALGIALRVAAIRALGRSFTSEIVAPPGHTLVTRGIYARMRHPSDIGLLFVVFGLASLGASLPAAAIASLVVAPSVALRIAREERLLSARHADAHAAYRTRVGVSGLSGWQRLFSIAT
jgi:protein-S-isoprenylcysteine O-methyltransferase Ste14